MRGKKSTSKPQSSRVDINFNLLIYKTFCFPCFEGGYGSDRDGSHEGHQDEWNTG